MLRAIPLLAIAACSAQPGAAGGSTRVHCGHAFALPLKPGDRVTTRSPVEDFVLHKVETGDGSLTIYEGNAPQPGGVVLRTGLEWPDQIVVHEAVDDADLAREIAERLMVGDKRKPYCSDDAATG